MKSIDHYSLAIQIVVMLLIFLPVGLYAWMERRKLRKQRQGNAMKLYAFRHLIMTHLAKQGIAIEGGFAEPFINWKHVDGPMLHTSMSQPHFLTWGERISLKFGWTTMEEIDYKICLRAMGIGASQEITQPG